MSDDPGHPVDDLGHPLALDRAPRRIVSLVPSLTEALAATCPERLVGATDWCIHPAGLDVARVRGTKSPDRAASAALEPDLVVANKEENRELDVRRLREAGVPVWVTDVNDVPQALASMRRLCEQALGVAAPAWLREAQEEWAGPVPRPGLRVACAIWRDPWMAVGSPTYTDDLMARLGWANACAGRSGAQGRPDRYPRVDPAELDGPGVYVVLLPDEPYVFTEDDGPEAFARVPTALVSGRLLTWYGPAMVGARAALGEQVARALG